MISTIANRLNKIAHDLLAGTSTVDSVEKKVDSIVSTASRNLDLDKYLTSKGYREEGGKVYIDPSKLTEQELKKITAQMKALEYDWQDAEGTKAILQRHVSHGWGGDQAVAIKKALGTDVNLQRGANSTQLNKITRAFGTTTNFLEAGYILSNGNLLDLSGKKDGGPPGTRAHDHRIVGGYMGVDVGSSGSQGMKAFMDTHKAIRIIHSSSGDTNIHTRTKPTDAQYKQILNLLLQARRMEGRVSVDVVGNTKDYDIGVAPNRVVEEIKRWTENLSDKSQ